MRWIDYEGKQPTDSDVPNWTAWTKEKWDAWRAKSKELLERMVFLDENNRIDERNKLIDDNRAHWDELKSWLRALSLGKCWFTETKNEGCHEDVEHFRPKKVARNSDGTDRGGYWWLAFDHTNYRLVGTVPNRMKGGWFPLHNDSRCSTFSARCEQSEAYALLDPTILTDTVLLAFNEEGRVIPSSAAADSWDLQRADLSIVRYKLNDHEPLPQGRRQIWQTISREIDSYLRAKELYHPAINPAARAQMEKSAATINRMTRSSERFSEVAICCVRLRNEPELIRLVDRR